VNISGTVIEESNKEPIEQATVRLLSIKDSSMVGGVATSRSGYFQLKDIKKGNYLLHISFVGFEPLYQPLQITGKTENIKLGKLTLSDASIELGEAVVIGKAPEVSVRNDTVEYNADSYKVTEGSMLEDLLKKMPGVEVDSEGKITVNGKEIKKVLVDGKEFFSDDPKVASKNLPSKMIDKVQVLDKLSDMAKMTGFDDGEEETVINLTVKPGMKQGWFGNAYGGYGSKDRYEGNAMVNRFINNDQITFMGGANNTNNMGFSDMAGNMFGGMRGGRGGFGGAGNGITSSGNAGLNFSKEFNDKMTLGGSATFAHSNNDALSKSDRQNILPNDSVSYYNERNESNTLSNTLGMNFRMEWKPDTTTQIIFTPSFSYSKSSSIQSTTYETLAGDLSDVNRGESEYYSDGHGYNLNAQLELSKKLNDKGRVLSVSLSGGSNNTNNEGTNYSDTKYYVEVPSNTSSLVDQKFDYTNKGFNYRAYLSWVEPLGHNNFLQLTYSVRQNKQEALKYSYNKDEYENYSVLDTSYSKSYRNNYVNQQASLAFKAKREKYDYTVGVTLEPSRSTSENFVGDTTLSKMSRSVVNFSPMLRFNYRFDKRTNLRINYRGRTSQPSMTQLQPVEDISNPLNTTIGNPDLKPTFTNSLNIAYQSFKQESQRAFMVMTNLNYVINDIVNKSIYIGNTGAKRTTYENVNGNYSGNMRVMINTPLKNKKFSINSMTMGSYSNSNGYINADKNVNKNWTVMERGGIDFRSDYLDLGVNGNIRYNGTRNSLQGQNDLNVYNYGVGGNTTIYLPWNFKIESDVNWSKNSGYSSGYTQNEVLWNASASKSFLKGNAATLRFKIYDILQQRSNISRSVTASYIQDSEYNTLSSYFMIHFIYKFSIFKGGASQKDMEGPEGRGMNGERPMGPPPGGGGGGFGGGGGRPF
jgi:hypothetical protein